ncbi:CACTA en-spm transposon protein [Cucumis melo var. makuwa]|uniref:CACTA en-spm transposon protein n=1 Tax=Cucumis melo var. makuwa TaxID=1194695 RepID=A0A5D3DI31_CUCMM|nr:CACTA en-spm transposon protein [Cucumis melo var. makuwa]
MPCVDAILPFLVVVAILQSWHYVVILELFNEMDAMFLEFIEDLNNPAGESSSVSKNSGTSRPSSTPTPRRRAQSRLLELEHYVHANGRILMSIASGAEKPILPYHFFVLDFNDQAMNRFVDHQMLSTFEEFRVDCHTHFKKYSNPEEARANPSHILMGRIED